METLIENTLQVIYNIKKLSYSAFISDQMSVFIKKLNIIKNGTDDNTKKLICKNILIDINRIRSVKVLPAVVENYLLELEMGIIEIKNYENKEEEENN